MRKIITINCHKQSDGYCIALDPRSKVGLKEDKYRPSQIFIEFDYGKIPKLSPLRWKLLCKGLLNFKRIVPCVVKDVKTKKTYFKFS